MIGQTNNLDYIDNLIDGQMYPQFTIFVGPKGSGKSAIVNHVLEKFNRGIPIYSGISAGEVRDTIHQAQIINGDIVFLIFEHADTMSIQAKNALLKIVEEPPKNAYFIMTLDDAGNTLDTIRSRATVINMQPYTPTEIGQYAGQFKLSSEEMRVVADICEVPGEVDMIINYGIISFDEYIKSVVDYVATVSGANCFKIAGKLKFKEDDTGYDVRLFLKAFITECSHRLMDDVAHYSEGIKITSRYLQDLRVNGISKQNLIDAWILDIRKAWMS